MKFLMAALAALVMASSPAVAEYPEREVLGVVMWGAGGATDTIYRYLLSTAWDLSTASYASDSLAVDDTSLVSVKLSDDGDILFYNNSQQLQQL